MDDWCRWVNLEAACYNEIEDAKGDNTGEVIVYKDELHCRSIFDGGGCYWTTGEVESYPLDR